MFKKIVIAVVLVLAATWGIHAWLKKHQEKVQQEAADKAQSDWAGGTRRELNYKPAPQLQARFCQCSGSRLPWKQAMTVRVSSGSITNIRA